LKDYPLVKFVLSFVVGILLHRIFQIDIWQILFLFTIITLSTYLIKKYFYSKLKDSITKLLFVPAFVLAGLLIASYHHKEFTSPLSKFYKEKNSVLFAEVKSIELIRPYEVLFNVISDSIIINDEKIKCNDELICKFRGDSLQRIDVYKNLKPGNKIFLTGTFQKGRERRNPYEFDYNQYLNSKGISGIFTSYNTNELKIVSYESSVFKSIVHQVRKKIDHIIHSFHTEKTAGLLRGLLLADRSEIDFETKNEFINSGVVHVLAVSGLHVGYILVIFLFIFGRFGIYTRSILTIIALFGFMILTGSTPSVTRATLMSIVIIISFLSNRSTNIVNSLSLAAFIILFFNPDEIYNPGFQLSFSAVLSIAIIYPKFRDYIITLRIKNSSIKNLLLFISVSLSAQIGTLPFTLAYFSKLSVIALLTNLIVIPLVGVIIGIAFITLFIGIILPSIAFYFGAANDLITSGMIYFIKYTGQLDFAFLWIRNYSLYDSIIFYSIITFLFYSISKIQKIWFKFSLFLISIILVLFYSTFDDKQMLGPNNLNILMIDVGQGDSFLIKFPNGKTALIDAGEATQFLDNGERVIIPLLDNLGIDKIDYGFISHLDSDHYGGFISLIYNDRIKEVYRPLPDSSLKSIRFEKFLKQKKIKTNIYETNTLKVGNANVYFLNKPKDHQYIKLSSNNKSGVVKIVYGKNSFLFVGDLEFQGEYLLAGNFSDILDSDVLKVGHHGSPTGTSQAFLNLVSPKISLVSAGIQNKFKHPSETVISSLKKIDSEIYRTDIEGAVLLQSNGSEIKKINWK
jgi:competence protein ComEC